jgi:hypothetical protein
MKAIYPLTVSGFRASLKLAAVSFVEVIFVDGKFKQT